MADYADFLTTKTIAVQDAGFDAGELPEFLYPFQRDCVAYALKKGRSAIFEDCGLGKTPQQLVWAQRVSQHARKPVLILAPLAVNRQTCREGDKFGIPVRPCRTQKDVGPGINIANYEMLEHFEPDGFGGLVLDESSILKNFNGVRRQEITAFGEQIPYRLACTATPAPNDLIEIINHSDFLSVMSQKEVVALFFRQDGNTTHKWRLKGHAEKDFWAWMASWSRAVRMPSDMGYPNNGFVLPPISVTQHTVDGHIEDGFLFPIEAHTLQERNQARAESIDERVNLAAELANQSNDPWLIWCDRNAESEMLTKAIPDAVEVKGSDDTEHKADAMLGFADGQYRVLVTKPSIAGFGMNWQHCAHMAFVGLSDSFEQYYQAVRRCWRFGQKNPVKVHVITANTEGAVVANIERKEHDAKRMMGLLVAHMKQHYAHERNDSRYDGAVKMELPQWIKESANVTSN